MDNTETNLGKSTRAIADTTAQKVQGGIRSAHEFVSNATDAVSGAAKDVQSEAAPLIRNAAHRAKSTAQQSIDAATDVTHEASGAGVNAFDSIVKYTKQNPVKALAVAAASGALLYVAVKALRSYRD